MNDRTPLEQRRLQAVLAVLFVAYYVCVLTISWKNAEQFRALLPSFAMCGVGAGFVISAIQVVNPTSFTVALTIPTPLLSTLIIVAAQTALPSAHAGIPAGEDNLELALTLRFFGYQLFVGFVLAIFALSGLTIARQVARLHLLEPISRLLGRLAGPTTAAAGKSPEEAAARVEARANIVVGVLALIGGLFGAK
jgi:hypothetical protein